MSISTILTIVITIRTFYKTTQKDLKAINLSKCLLMLLTKLQILLHLFHLLQHRPHCLHLHYRRHRQKNFSLSNRWLIMCKKSKVYKKMSLRWLITSATLVFYCVFHKCKLLPVTRLTQKHSIRLICPLQQDLSCINALSLQVLPCLSFTQQPLVHSNQSRRKLV